MLYFSTYKFWINIFFITSLRVWGIIWGDFILGMIGIFKGGWDAGGMTENLSFINN